MSNITLRRKSLILSPKVYQYILFAYGDTELPSMCFEDILIMRNYIDVDLTHVLEVSTCDSITSTFNLYVKEKVSFKPKYLNILQKATSMEIINPFFDDFLPSVFGINPTYKYFGGSRPNSQSRELLTERFLDKLEKISSLDRRNQGELSINFRESFVNFCNRLENETHYRIRDNNSDQHRRQRYDNRISDS